MTGEEYSKKSDTQLARTRELMKQENAAHLRFIKAARQHTLAIRPGDTVMYIENNLDNVNLIKAFIEHTCSRIETQQLRFLHANTVDDARCKIRERLTDIKLVILDMDLGEHAAFDFLDWLVKRYEKSVPVLILTSTMDETQQLRSTYPDFDIVLKSETEKLQRALQSESSRLQAIKRPPLRK